ncbi:PREDICTED: Fc receptor-like protein 5 [Cyprinodon variegatus]|uniref:Fc receptor-like protein 5 n=1 Tax=Cyprinodon variegatus TaxID=28743 RepID=UPI00074298D4|nr:PREDICTED: Fc receptor-like protein 5 [Cyprinodon variegatus]
MQVTPLCLMLTCLKVSPDRSQFFRYESISLSCEDPLNSTDWKVKRNTSDGGVRLCSSGWGFASAGFSCIIGNTYPKDTGVYWCESDGQERSNVVNITITDRRVILESPTMPVPEGTVVVLRCKAKTDSSKHRYNFYKDGRIIMSNTSGEISIFSASRSDEGLYTCGASGLGESEGSWLTVLAPVSPLSSFPVSRVLCHLIVGIPYLLSTFVLGLIYRDRKTAARIVAERKS